MPALYPSLTRPRLRDHLRTTIFPQPEADQVGAEVELFPVVLDGGRVDVPTALAASDRLWEAWPDGGASGDGEAIDWRGGRLTREPGGQWEFSGPPLDSPEACASAMGQAVARLQERAIPAGFDFLAAGLHPWADVESVGLHKKSRRYVAMQAYYDRIGPLGRRMMRLTTSVQVAVDFRPVAERAERWELAQRLAPVLTAAFANSAVTEGRPGPIPGLRAQTWLGLDPARTGIPAGFLDDPGADPVEQYLDFALKAPVMFLQRAEGPFELPPTPTPFEVWMAEGLPGSGYPDLSDWEMHLSTLFPDVRPKGYLEIRAMDSPGLAWLAVPVLVVGHALRDPVIRRELLDRCRPHHEALSDLRVRAANQALADPTLRTLAQALFAAVLRKLNGAEERLVACYAERYIQPGTTPGEELRARIPENGPLEPAALVALESERALSYQAAACG